MWQRARIRAPRLRGEAADWLNNEGALSFDELVGDGIVLVDFWDYTCVNCIRTLPYLRAWHERYAPLGLTILGIHTPEFAFAKQRAAVAAAVERFDLRYPILLDSEQDNWSAFANRAWPTKYLIDAQRIIRWITVGEGRYEATEQAIQTLLRELHGDNLPLPPIMEPLRPTDEPGAVCYPTTPELFAGYAHGRLGNPQGWAEGAPRAFPPVPPAAQEEGRLYFAGAWQTFLEHSETTEGSATLSVPYRAAESNAVLASATGEPLRVYVAQDGQPLGWDDMGEDIVVDSELGSYLTVHAPRMYNLTRNPDFTTHTITLFPTAPGLRVYSFSFVSCRKPS